MKSDEWLESGDINATGVVVLLAGLLAVIVGAIVAISAQRNADSTDYWDRIFYPGEYDSHKAAANASWTVAKIGGLLMFLGYVIAIAVRSTHAAGIVLIVAGILVVIVGANAAISAQSNADSMNYQERAYFSDEYDSYVATASAGWTLAGIGALLAIVGLAMDVAVRRSETSPQGGPQ